MRGSPGAGTGIIPRPTARALRLPAVPSGCDRAGSRAEAGRNLEGSLLRRPSWKPDDKTDADPRGAGGSQGRRPQGNASQQSSRRAQSRGTVSPGAVAHTASSDAKEEGEVHGAVHHIAIASVDEAFFELKETAQRARMAWSGEITRKISSAISRTDARIHRGAIGHAVAAGTAHPKLRLASARTRLPPWSDRIVQRADVGSSPRDHEGVFPGPYGFRLGEARTTRGCARCRRSRATKVHWIPDATSEPI